jgi:hypothetical protein
MENALIVPEQPALPAELTATLDLAADFAKASKAKATPAPKSRRGALWRGFSFERKSAEV